MSTNSSKKRPPPSTDMAGARVNYSDPSIASPHDTRGDQHGLGRARSFPYDLSVNISKPISLPESTSSTAQSFDEQDTSHLNTWNVGTTSAVMTPTSATTPFSSQHLDNPNLPDMKPVMFPSDNPFAYPNQPMSTLEAQQSLSAEQQNSYSSTASSSMYNVSMSSNPTPASFSFDNTQMPAFPGSFSVPQTFMQQGRQINAPISGPPSFDPPAQMDESTDLNAINFPAEGYWSQMDRTGGGRAGLTPGGINLDELFGGEGWSNIWNNQSLAR